MSRKKSSIGFDPLAWMKPAAGSEAPAVAKAPSGRASEPPAKPVTKPAPVPQDGPTVIVLGEALGIGDVRSRHSEWRTQIARGGRLEIDGARLAQVDTAALQLLASLAREADGKGIALRWRGASDALRQGAERLGLKSVLHLS